MQIVYAYFLRTAGDITQTEKELFSSIHKTYELFHYLLELSVDIRNYAQNKIDNTKNRYIKSNSIKELGENFISNKLIALIDDNYLLNTFLNNNKFSWVNYPELTRDIYTKLLESDFFEEYLLIEQPSFKQDKEIINKLYTQIIANSEVLFQVLEELSIYWNDDVEFVISNIINTLNKFTLDKAADNSLPQMYKSDDDIDFVKNLFRKCILRHQEHSDIIEKYLKNWKVERVAMLDMVLLEMALSELYYLDEVPVKVTLNEYIELSKYYSTEKSSTFINGILDKIVQDGRIEGKIVKRGKGLIGETN